MACNSKHTQDKMILHTDVHDEGEGGDGECHWFISEDTSTCYIYSYICFHTVMFVRRRWGGGSCNYTSKQKRCRIKSSRRTVARVHSCGIRFQLKLVMKTFQRMVASICTVSFVDLLVLTHYIENETVNRDAMYLCMLLLTPKAGSFGQAS